MPPLPSGANGRPGACLPSATTNRWRRHLLSSQLLFPFLFPGKNTATPRAPSTPVLCIRPLSTSRLSTPITIHPARPLRPIPPSLFVLTLFSRPAPDGACFSPRYPVPYDHDRDAAPSPEFPSMTYRRARRCGSPTSATSHGLCPIPAPPVLFQPRASALSVPTRRPSCIPISFPSSDYKCLPFLSRKHLHPCYPPTVRCTYSLRLPHIVHILVPEVGRP